ncbi:VWA domain-containing protein [Bacillus salacetis]|uniref:VWA domain-containing protein n=1 Tax=Bacillus salacetis TaxID=2315464 RepID=A0A3A1R4B1_9BACI|nr:BatA and WFA domain-containing protein [Bacillus salacetis]RIW37384.1 VWA domain-containing protein [Bacillus salacetis]
MGFLTPAYFWLTGFLAVLILFYLFRKQFTEKEISSTLLWDQLIQEWKANRWWKKLQRHILLLLQILIVCFLILALAQPFLSGKGINGDHVVAVIDTSASMQADEGERTRFEEAKAEVLTMVDSLGSGQQMSLLTAGKVPQLIFSNESEKQRMKSAISELVPSHQEDSMVQAAGYASSLIQEGEGEIHLYTDSLTEEEIEEVPFSNKVVVHNIGEQRDNLSLKSFGVAKTDGGINGVLTVGNENKEDQTVTVRIEGREGTVKKSIEVKAEETEMLSVEGLGESDYYEAILENEDAYEADNRVSAFLGGQSETTVYLAGKANPFLEKVLPLLGHEPVVLSQDEDGKRDYPQDRNALYILSGIKQENWPDGPKLILAPAEGGSFSVNGKVEAGEELKSTASSPLLRYVDMEQVFLQSRFPYENKDLEPLVLSGDNPVISTGSFEGSPLVLIGFDLQDSDWPLQPGFPIFMKNALEFLQQENQSLGYAAPDEKIQMTFSADAQSAEVIQANDGKTVTDLKVDSDTISAPGDPGVYQVKESTSTGTRDRYLAVLLPEKEQSIATEQSFSIGSSNTANQEETQSIHPLWKWAALFAFILLIMEWEVYRRGISA